MFFGPIKLMGFLRRGKKTKEVFPACPKGQYYFEHLAVYPKIRGGGVGTALFKHGLDYVKKQGFEKAYLDVSLDNPQAEKLYKRLGFKEFKVTIQKDLENLGIGKWKRMVINLQ